MKPSKKRILIGYCHPSCKPYKPKVNRKRQAGLVSVIGITGFLPGPNVLGLFITKIVNKVNPLWVYQ